MNRNLTLDGQKFLCAALIVMIHVAGDARTVYSDQILPTIIVNMGYWALYFFFMVAGYLHGPLGTRGGAFIKKRFIRLGVPYLFWSCAFLAFREVLALASHNPLVTVSPLDFFFFAGAAAVLWSLLMLIYAAVMAELVVKSPALRRIAMAVAGLGAVAVLWIPAGAFPAGLPPYFVMTPMWFFVYLLGMELRAGALRGPSRGLIYQSAAILAVAALGGCALLPALGVGPRPLAFLVAGLDVVAAAALLVGAAAGLDLFHASRLSAGDSTCSASTRLTTCSSSCGPTS